MLQLTITEGPRFNLRGPDICGATPAQMAHYVRFWYPGAVLDRFPAAVRLVASAATCAPEITGRDPDLEVLGWIEWDDPDEELGASARSSAGSWVWPADLPAPWSAVPDDMAPGADA